MSYLLDRKLQRKKFFFVGIFVFIFLILFHFRSGFWNVLSYTSHTFLSPVLVLGNGIGEKLGGVNVFFTSKNALYLENQNLQLELDKANAFMSNYDSVLSENTSLKEILGRKNEKTNMTLAAILSKPNQSPYDTLILDVGIKQDVRVGDIVFALGNVPIGRIAEVYPASSKVILFSNSGEKTQVIFSSVSTTSLNGKNISLEVVGRGGGNFEMIIPIDFSLSKGDQVLLPGIMSYVVATVDTIISDPRDPFVKALLVSPANVQELKFVEVAN